MSLPALEPLAPGITSVLGGGGLSPAAATLINGPADRPQTNDRLPASGRALGVRRSPVDDQPALDPAGKLAAIRRATNRVVAQLEGDKLGLEDLTKNRNEQTATAWVSEYIGGGGVFGKLELPDKDTVWKTSDRLVAEVRSNLEAGDVIRAARALQGLSDAYITAHRQVAGYREGVIGGAGRSTAALEVAAAAGAIAATIATGGAAAAAAPGAVLAPSLVAAATAGSYGLMSEEATQGGEMLAGTRTAGDFDLVKMLKRGGTDAAVSFVGAFAGGMISKYAVSYFGRAAMAQMSSAQLAALADALGVEVAALSPQLFISAGRKLILDFFAGAAVTPLTTAFQATLDGLQGKAVPQTAGQFAELVLKNAIQGGLVQLFVAGLTHGAAGVPKNGRNASPAGPVPAGASGSGTGMSFHEIDLGPTGPHLELDTANKPAAQQPGLDHNLIDPESIPSTRAPGFGPATTEKGGTGARTGMHFNEFNQAEISPARLRIDYDPAGRPRKVTFQITPGMAATAQISERSFGPDTSTDGAQSRTSAYKKSGYERGHLAPREAFAGEEGAEQAADLLTNVVPMTEALNRGKGSPWRDSERRTFVEAAKRNEALVVEVEPIYAEKPPTLRDGTPIPRAVRRRVTTLSGEVVEDSSHLNKP
jgi:hypothetical protein